jgi:hypothetical protein
MNVISAICGSPNFLDALVHQRAFQLSHAIPVPVTAVAGAKNMAKDWRLTR